MSNQNTNTRGTLLLIVVGSLLMLAYWQAGKYFWPTKPKEEDKPAPSAAVVAAAASRLGQPDGQPWNALAGMAAADAEKNRPKEQVAEKPPEKPPEKPEPEVKVDPELLKPVTLGTDGSHLQVTLDPRGAGVSSLVMEHFQAAKADGEPDWIDEKRKIKRPLELIPADKNAEVGSFLLYHYDRPGKDDFPLDTLGKRVWKRVEPAEYKEGDLVRRAVFETTVRGVKVTKTYTLEPRAYHVGLEVRLELVDPNRKEVAFRYLLTGAHGLPIEGQWYATVFRNALIARVDEKGGVDRKLQTASDVAFKGGGDEVVRGDDSIRYAGVANQFFASVIAVETNDQDNKDFLATARPLLMESATKGKVVGRDGDEVKLRDDKGKDSVYFLTKESRERFDDALKDGAEVIVVHRTAIDRAGRGREVVTGALDANATAPIFHDDITVAVTTPGEDGKVIKLKTGEVVVHKYTLYNGPVKVRLLNHLTLDAPIDDKATGTPAVDEKLVDHYLDDLHLDTLTDYRSPGWFNDNVMKYTPWTRVLVFFTNVMHTVLWWLYSVLPVYGLCIILLTVMVRGAMHPLSRKQALMTVKMQALKPELDKLKEKYKADKQGLGMAQMELYRKHGVSPFGSCWVMFLQMPIFLGLYYALQESIHFRLAPFLWIKNLAAPDMLIHWGDKVPLLSYVSDWSHYGGFLWLGPFFNLLPVVAVALMMVQQKATMPPPADEQAAMQQKMMKYMMIFFGIMFYKVAAGLCLYFIASSAWGWAERKLLPKAKPGGAAPAASAARPSLVQKVLRRIHDAQRQRTGAVGTPPGANGNGAAPTALTATPPGGGKKKRDRRRGGQPAGAAPAPAGGPAGLWAKVREWWAEVRRQAEKK